MKSIKILVFFITLSFSLFAQTEGDNQRSWIRHTKNTNHGKIALVIGNSNYQYGTMLSETIKDANVISAALKTQGYDVEEGLNLDKNNLYQVIEDFSARLKNYNQAVIFYAGHGFQVDGENYIVPIDANPTKKWHLGQHCINLNDIFEAINEPNKPKLIILDACRDNPFSLEGTDRNMSIGMTTIVSSKKNAKIIFSTSPKTT